MNDYLIKICRYNVWANGKLMQFVSNAGEPVCMKELKSSFPTIRKTVQHLLDAQLIWMNRVNGINEIDWPPTGSGISTAEICKLLLESSNEWLKFAQKMDQSIPAYIVEYKNMNGDPFSNTISEIITHVMNHGTFHRGQVVTMLRINGFEQLEPTDLIAWYRLKE